MGRLVPVCLEDLRPITTAEHEAALGVIAQVQEIAAWRGAGASADDVWLPAGNWARESTGNDFMDAYRHVSTGAYDVINNLRYYTNCFNGSKLLHFQNVGITSVMALPEDSRPVIAANLHRLVPVVDQYRRLRRMLPPHLLINPPRMLAEVGADVDGVVVNLETLRHQATVAALWQLGVLAYLEKRAAEFGTAHVVEIGGGHGGLCRHLKRLLPQLTYTLIDLPESLLHSGIFLTLTAPEWSPTLAGRDGVAVRPFGIHLVPNFLFAEALAALPRVDLAVNISSFGEMEPAQVTRYAAGLSARMPKGGLLYEYNETDMKHIRCDTPAVVSQRFRASCSAAVKGVPVFEGTPRMHANVPLAQLLPIRPLPLKSLKPRWLPSLGNLSRRVVGKVKRLLSA